jgi:cation transport regulator ChaB
MLFHLTNRIAAQARKESWHNREYLVVPMTLISEGVLAGNEGPLLYPGTEIQKNPSQWNGMPIVVYPETYHPKVNGRYVTARDPKTLMLSEVGRIFNTQAVADATGLVKLVCEGWFDAELTKKIDVRVYNALVNGTPMELSTGLGGTVHAAPDASIDHKGRAYSYVARNYSSDHVAILPDKRGACSLSDGCGIFANQESQYQWNDTHSQEVETPNWSITPKKPSTTRNLTNIGWIVNPQGQWTPPASGNAPAEVKRILKAVYSQYRDKHPAENSATKAKGAKIAWGAVRKAGWVKDKSGNWKKRKKATVGNIAAVQPSLWSKIGRMIGNAVGIRNQPSHSDIRQQLQSQLEDRFYPDTSSIEYQMGMSYDPVSSVWIVDVFDKYVVYSQDDTYYKLAYTTDLRTNDVALSSDTPQEVNRVTTYKAVSSDVMNQNEPNLDDLEEEINEPGMENVNLVDVLGE